jgi:hypothetical protein
MATQRTPGPRRRYAAMVNENDQTSTSKMFVQLANVGEEVYADPIRIEVLAGSSRQGVSPGMEISADRYGVKTMEPDCGAVAYLEQYNGELRLLVWADINQEDPTHVISLEGAHESKRRDEIFDDAGNTLPHGRCDDCGKPSPCEHEGGA